MDSTLAALYHRHVAASFDRQMRFADFLEREASGAPWSYTISTASLVFGGGLRFVAFDLGSHAEPDNSWLWSWCNPTLNLTPANRELGNAVRKLGRRVGVRAFAARRQLSCDELLGPDLSPVAAHVFAAIVVGELGFDAYWVMPFSQGQAAAVIRDDRLRIEVPNPIIRISTIFSQVIMAFPVPDHRAAFIAYVGSYELPVEQTARTVRVLAGGKEALKATFDRRNRLTKLAFTLGPGE
jgi:hypothetical protein